MEEKYIEITCEVESSEQGEMLIARLNEGIEAEGFEEGEGFVKVYIPETKYNEAVFYQLMQPDTRYSISVVKNENWNAIWENSFEPVIVENFVAVRANFHKSIKNVAYEIIITPKMSFGTGHHATTGLMLESLQQNNCAGKKVADFGTGTGILAILAEKMNAEKVLAIDYDDWSIENASENIKRNRCRKIQLIKEDHFPGGEKWDIILANINLHVILANMQSFHQTLNNNGLLIISGILQEDRTEVESLAFSQSFLTHNVQQKNNWLCMAFKKEATV
ncbi:50S ribosomal protein L11 methyltransferase [Agriterribacter humi]|uniref:50S ribosomal protein L11 methyltransferase n=1 Tax=Agriterribacter humi TaxID=1104781 RepID=UPI0012642721|nr:50S ribosomal protein L11 methyltransferase [Agriterribacter humi]